MMRSTFKQRKHNKTFTGCWTCRARKVKCDEGKPACNQCRTKSLHCEGYGVRLQWMQSDQNASDRNLPRGRLQRSQIAYEPNCQSLDASEIDDILFSIDSFDSEDSTRTPNETLFIHSFGVFNPVLPSMEGSVRPLSPHSSDNDGGGSSTNPEADATLLITTDDQLHDDITLDESSLFLGSAENDMYLGDENSSLQPDFDSSFGPTTPLNKWFEGSSLVLHQPEEDIPQQQQESPGQYQWRSLSDALIRQPSSSSLPEQEQLLMYHYSHRAVNLFCVIDNKKSPWKTIHLPRALQSIGQISVAGSTSPIRNALRHALLSISAFSLSNDSKLRISAEEAERWARKGTVLRGHAIELLKDAVTNDFNGKSAPKYKEFLATMLSMVTINVMSGDTTTCGMHLDGALRFITQARAWKTKFSPKAVALHRIYFYLRTIYDSTALKDHESLPLPASQDVPRPLLLNPTATESVVEVRPLAMDAEAPKAGMQMSTYECIYGVPQNLLVLLSKSTALVREVEAFREANGRADMPADLTSKCDDLEQWVMDWAVEKELERCRIDGMGASSEIIRQSTYAFHNALIIYFAQHIRLLSHRYLQSYVQNVLESIEAIETIKTESQIMAAPNYWPAFIAASEAFNEGLQGRFKTWYDQVEVYGIEAVRSGICVLTEVWARGPTTGQDTTSRWKSVVQETGAHLMLS